MGRRRTPPTSGPGPPDDVARRRHCESGVAAPAVLAVDGQSLDRRVVPVGEDGRDRHEGRVTTTSSPTATDVTAAPTASTTPATSQPGTWGRCGRGMPRVTPEIHVVQCARDHTDAGRRRHRVRGGRSSPTDRSRATRRGSTRPSASWAHRRPLRRGRGRHRVRRRPRDVGPPPSARRRPRRGCRVELAIDLARLARRDGGVRQWVPSGARDRASTCRRRSSTRRRRRRRHDRRSGGTVARRPTGRGTGRSSPPAVHPATIRGPPSRAGVAARRRGPLPTRRGRRPSHAARRTATARRRRRGTRRSAPTVPPTARKRSPPRRPTSGIGSPARR